MKTPLSLVLAVVASSAWCQAQPQPPAAGTRVWTDDMGRKVEASFGGVQGDQVMLKMAGGRTVPFAIGKLSAADQEFIKTQPSGGAATSGAPAASETGRMPAATSPAAIEAPRSRAMSVERLPMDKRVTPDRVEVPAKTVEANLITENASERKYVYQTEMFEFSSQAKLAKSVMTEVAQTFEATRLLLTKLPWGLDCRPPEGLERYQAKLFETRGDYIQAGGPENSGGVYNSGLKVFMVPFPSLGLEKRGQTYYKKRDFRNDTLVHEITHQVMDDYLSFLPIWIIEGTAEYTEMLPDTANGFLYRQHESGIKDYVKGGEKRLGGADLGGLEEHMTMTREVWSAQTTNSTSMFRLYYRSAMLVYFFNHLDGDGKGTRFMKYMDAVFGEVQAMREFFANPAVKRSPGGGFTYPRSLTPPDFRKPFKHLDILLDGRSYAQLATEIVDKYKAKGLKVTAK